MKKKVSCECFRIDLTKKTKKTTATQKTKNSLLIIRAIQSHCSLTRENYDRVQVRGQKKEKRPVTVALPYPPLLHQNEGKLNKKNRNRKRFSCFFNNTTKKDELFSF